METFGDIIRKLREDKGLPLRTVAAYLEMDQAILSKMERGIRNATRQNVVKLAKYYDAKENDLLVAWLSDKLVDELEDEEVALMALRLAEEKVAYIAYKKIDRKSIARKLKTYFAKDSRVEKAWIFGSFARGEDDYKSDIDIMIEVPENSSFTLFDMADIQYHLENMIPKKIDVVMKDSIRPHIMERIKPELKLVYEK